MSTLFGRRGGSGMTSNSRARPARLFAPVRRPLTTYAGPRRNVSTDRHTEFFASAAGAQALPRGVVSGLDLLPLFAREQLYLVERVEARAGQRFVAKLDHPKLPPPDKAQAQATNRATVEKLWPLLAD